MRRKILTLLFISLFAVSFTFAGCKKNDPAKEEAKVEQKADDKAPAEKAAEKKE